VSYPSLDEAFQGMRNIEGDLIVIGGTQVFKECLLNYSEACKMIVITRINKSFESDTFMPKFDSSKYTCVFQSAVERFENEFTYDYCFYMNR
jgi:dihydrofolate reductase